mmetsp:Transcript_100826/g.323573  ORF Transcript_100826/g.323573 Transcript_100826/m.323573 type:complete len:230 (+) Transcript_100826:1656-2345(+)
MLHSLRRLLQLDHEFLAQQGKLGLERAILRGQGTVLQVVQLPGHLLAHPPLRVESCLHAVAEIQEFRWRICRPIHQLGTQHRQRRRIRLRLVAQLGDQLRNAAARLLQNRQVHLDVLLEGRQLLQAVVAAAAPRRDSLGLGANGAPRRHRELLHNAPDLLADGLAKGRELGAKPCKPNSSRLALQTQLLGEALVGAPHLHELAPERVRLGAQHRGPGGATFCSPSLSGR